MADQFGAVERTSGGHRLTYVRSYEISPVDLWDAITNPIRVERWLAPLSGVLREGGAFQVDFADSSDPEQVSAGSIDLCETPTRLRFTWSFGTKGDSACEAKISSDGTKSELSFVHDLPTAQAVGYGAGWHAYLDRLEAEVANAEIPNWETLLMAYLSHYQRGVANT